MDKTSYEIRDRIVSLKVYLPNHTYDLYEVGMNAIKRIEFSAGTSGVEYSVIYEDHLLQFRGGHNYTAKWSLR